MCIRDRDTPGPIARSVADAAVMYDAMSTDKLNIDLSAGISGIRIGSLSDEEREGIDPEQLHAYDRALDQIADLGADIVQFEPTKTFEEMKEASAVILTAEGYFHHGALMDNPESLVDENVRSRFVAGAAISSAQYVGALLQRDSDRQSLSLAIQNIDALVMPTTPMLPVSYTHLTLPTTPYV